MTEKLDWLRGWIESRDAKNCPVNVVDRGEDLTGVKTKDRTWNVVKQTGQGRAGRNRDGEQEEERETARQHVLETAVN